MSGTPDRARLPHGNRGTSRARRVRSHGAALVLVAAGALLGWALPRAERYLPVPGLTFDASTAQASLAAIAGGMITLAGFVVTAITLVVQTVQAASPRLVSALGHFSRYLVLFGLLIGTALFALVALSHIRGQQVPRLSVTLSVGLVLVDAVAVLHLLASLRHAVTGGGLSRAVGDRLRTVIDQLYPTEGHVPGPLPQVPEHSGAQRPFVHRGRPAVIFAIDEPRLTRLATRHDVRIHLLHSVGDFIATGAVVGYVECQDAVVSPRLVRRVAGGVRYGPSRTVQQDAAYGFRLLADIAIRALSPAINDPTTALQALDQIEDGLLRLSHRPLGPAWLLGKDGRPRVVQRSPGWPDFVSLALDETLQYGTSNVQVVRRLRTLFDRLLTAAPEDRKPPLVDRRNALDRLSSAALPDPLLRQVADHPDQQGIGGRTESPERHPR